MRRPVMFILGVLLMAAMIYGACFFIFSRVKAGGRKPLIYATNDYMLPRFRSSTWWQYQEFDPQRSWDAVIMGSSHAYRGYDPFIFKERGYHVFNLGTSAETPLNTYCLGKEYLDSVRTPVVILDLYDIMFTQNGLESTVDLIQNLGNNHVVLDMAMSSGDLRGLNMLSLRLLEPRETPPGKPAQYVGLGFSPNPDTVLVSKDPVNTDMKLDHEQEEAFTSLIDLCAERHVRLILCSHQMRNGAAGSFHLRFRASIDSLIAGRGIPYLDYSNSILLNDPDHFSLGSHLNQAGARIFTNHLVDSLESLGYLRKP